MDVFFQYGSYYNVIIRCITFSDKLSELAISECYSFTICYLDNVIQPCLAMGLFFESLQYRKLTRCS